MGKICHFLLISSTLLYFQMQCCESAQGKNIDPEIQRKIDDFIQNVYLPASQISGLGLSIVQNNGEVLYTTGYGLADEEKRIVNGNATQFLIGSLTKSFTSALIVKLLHENFPQLGEAALDTPIRKLLPQANFTLIDRFRSEHGTFRDLLAHRMCLFRDDSILVGDPFDTAEELAYRTRYNEEICGVRGEFQYNNQMYAVAGELAGILANKSYEEAMQDLLNEIGMTNTTFAQRSDDFTRMPYRAMPYYVMDNETHPFNTELIKRIKAHNAAGGLFATPNDMAAYMQFHLNLGSMDGKQVIPREVMQWLTKPSTVLPAFEFKNSEGDLIVNRFSYGLGLGQASYDGWSCLLHGGSFSPYQSLLNMFPTQQLGIFTTTNMGPVMMDQQVLHAFIFETLKGTQNPEEKAMKLKEEINSEKEVQKKKANQKFQAFYQSLAEKAALQDIEQADIVGKYGSGSTGDAEVSEKFNEQTNQTEYYFQYGRWYSGWLQEEVDGSGVIFKLLYDTDVVQDEYAEGLNGENTFIGFENETLIVFTPFMGQNIVRATFKLGVSLDVLPPVPWSPDSCGPE